MKAHRRRIVILAVVLTLAVACAHTPNIKTAQGQTAYRADQIVVRVNDLQNVAIAAEQSGALPTATTRAIVQTCLAMNVTLKATPAGWQTTVRAAWSELKFRIGVVTDGTVTAALAIIDAMLEALL